MRAIAAAILRWTGLGALARRILARRGRFVIELHGIARRRFDELPAALQPSLTVDELEEILDWLIRRFRLLTAEEFLAGDRPGVLLSFDDGYANQAFSALPLLERYRAPAVFFVTTRHVAEPGDWLPAIREGLATIDEKPAVAVLHELYDGMSVEQLRACATSPWITIGSHTRSHPRLTRCDDDALEEELSGSRRFLEEHTGRVVDLFAYPTGDYDRRVAMAVRRAGYRAAFVEESRHFGLGRFEIPRVGLYRAGSAYLGAKLSGLHRRPLPPGACCEGGLE